MLQQILQLLQSRRLRTLSSIISFFLQPGRKYFDYILDDILLVSLLSFDFLAGIFIKHSNFLNVSRTFFIFLLAFLLAQGSPLADIGLLCTDFELVLNTNELVFINDLRDFEQVLPFLIAQVIVHFHIRAMGGQLVHDFGCVHVVDFENILRESFALLCLLFNLVRVLLCLLPEITVHNEPKIYKFQCSRQLKPRLRQSRQKCSTCASALEKLILGL